MMNENTNEMGVDFAELMSAGKGGGKFNADFSDGVYTGKVIAAVRSDIEYEGVIKTKDMMVIQLFDDSGNAQTLRTGGYIASLNDKSNCYKLLSSLSKETEPVKIGETLPNMGLIVDGQFSFGNFVGKDFNFMITMTPTKAGKLFPKITGIMLPKANQSHEFKTDVKAPWFFFDDAKAKVVMDGVQIFTQKDAVVVEPELDAFTESLKADMA